MDSCSRMTGFTYQACKELEWLVSDFVWSRALAEDTGQVLVGEAHVPLARSLGRHVLPPLRRAAPIGQHAPLAGPAELHRRGRGLIAAVPAAAPRGAGTAFAPSVGGETVRGGVSKHRAPLRGRVLRGGYYRPARAPPGGA